MDWYNMMETCRLRHAELIREAQDHNRLVANQGLSAFDRAVICFSEKIIALGHSLRRRYALELSSAERA